MTVTREAHVVSVDPAIAAFVGACFGFLSGLFQGIGSMMTGSALGFAALIVSPLLSALGYTFAFGLTALLLNFLLRRVGGLRVELAA